MITGARTRADRLRLLQRVEVAERAVELLRSKEEALERERDRLEGHARRAADEWQRAGAAAAAGLLRARLLGASDEVVPAVVTTCTADVRPHWQVSMGITYPGAVDVEPGDPPALVSTAALGPAIELAREALVAAARHAAASTAVRRLGEELVETRRRRRAIDERLVPSLRTTCHDLDLHLDELDRDEAMRVRTAAGRTRW